MAYLGFRISLTLLEQTYEVLRKLGWVRLWAFLLLRTSRRGNLEWRPYTRCVLGGNLCEQPGFCWLLLGCWGSLQGSLLSQEGIGVGWRT